MRVYFKNGKSLRINQKTANELSKMKVDEEKDVLIQRNIISKNIYLMIDINEIVAIK